MTITQMSTLAGEHRHSAVYWGERGHWLVAMAIHRDSGTLERSNWDAAIALLGGESGTVAIERSTHWAVGWVDYLVIDPEAADKVQAAEEMRSRIEDYPVLDEESFSRLEWDEYYEAWQDYGASDFVKGLVRKFSLSDTATELLDGAETLQEFYESLIPSGEFYIAEGSGVSVQTQYAVDKCTRERIADYLRELR